MVQVESAASVDRDQLRERVRTTLTWLSRTGELPPLPGAAALALAVARDPGADTDDLCRVIRADVGLSARLIRAAGSASYARRAPARSLQDAVLTVGARRTCDLLVASVARRQPRVAGEPAARLWGHAHAVAVAAEELARVTGRVPPAAAFLVGLFHDVGRIAFLLADPEAYAATWQLGGLRTPRVDEVERAWYGFDHAEAGAILVEEWGLASEQCDAIRWHHQPRQADTGRPLAVLVEAAGALADRLGRGTSPGRRTLQAVLGVAPEDEEVLLARVRRALGGEPPPGR